MKPDYWGWVVLGGEFFFWPIGGKVKRRLNLKNLCCSYEALHPPPLMKLAAESDFLSCKFMSV